MFLVLVLAIITPSVVSADSSWKDEPRIFNGQAVNIQDFPYMVSLERHNIVLFAGLDGHKHWCGGTIISRSHIVTAAHCFYDENHALFKVSDFTVRINSTFSRKGGIVVHIAELYTHLKYDYKTALNDIAVLKLANKLNLGVGIQPVQLPISKKPLPVNARALVTGWGELAFNLPNYEEQLMLISVTIVSFKTCLALYRNYSQFEPPEGMLCAGNGLQDACRGDSGSPLVADNVLYGIVSSGPNCVSPLLFPGLYTDVIKYLDFIKEKMAL